MQHQEETRRKRL